MKCRIFPSLSKGIVRPGIKKLKPLPELGIVFATKNDFDLFKKRFHIKGGGFNFLMSQIYVLDHFCIAGPYFGAPYAASILENLASSGVKKFIFIGWCGAFREGINPGDIFFTSESFSDEGCSKSYMNGIKDCFYPEEDFFSEIYSFFKCQNINVKKSSLFSTDAIYRETTEKIDFFKKLGAEAVDMENSAIYAVAEFLNLKVIAINVVSDIIEKDQWKPGFKNKNFKRGRETLIDGVISYVCSRKYNKKI